MPCSFLVGLAAPYRDAQPVPDLHQVADPEGDELGTAEGAGKAERQQGAVTLTGERLWTTLSASRR